MLRIAIIRSPQRLEPLRSAWERLYRDGSYSIFQSPEWNLLAARAFASVGEPMVIHANGESGAAIIPACLTRGQVQFLGEALFDYRDVLASGEQRVLRRAWQQVAVQQQPLSVAFLHGERTCRQWKDLGFSPALFCGAPMVRRSETSPEDFYRRHSRAHRLLGRLTRAGVELRTHQGSETALVRYIYEAKAAQQLAGVDGNLFAERARIDFMVAIAAMDNRCEIFTLETAGTLVGALVTFRDGIVRRFYTVHYDRAWANYSPGTALMFETTRRSLEQGLDCDYLTGEQPHKTRFATYRTPLFRLEADARNLARITGLRLAPVADAASQPIAA